MNTVILVYKYNNAFFNKITSEFCSDLNLTDIISQIYASLEYIK